MSKISFHVLVGRLEILFCEVPFRAFCEFERGGCSSSTYWIIDALKYLPCLFVSMYLLCLFIFETEHKLERGRDRNTHTESEAGSRLRAVSTEPNARLESTNREIMTWAKVRHLTNWATQVPPDKLDFKPKTVTRDEERHYIIIKGSILQKI